MRRNHQLDVSHWPSRVKSGLPGLQQPSAMEAPQLGGGLLSEPALVTDPAMLRPPNHTGDKAKRPKGGAVPRKAVGCGGDSLSMSKVVFLFVHVLLKQIQYASQKGHGNLGWRRWGICVYVLPEPRNYSNNIVTHQVSVSWDPTASLNLAESNLDTILATHIWILSHFNNCIALTRNWP